MPTTDLDALIARHRPTLERALDACRSRESWSPFSDSPSTAVHGPEKPAAGKAAVEALFGRPFPLEQPGTIGWIGEEVSPYTRRALGVTYPKADPAALIAAAEAAMPAWIAAGPEARVALCLEMIARTYDRVFEIAHAVMHTAGQPYIQAYAGSGPNALDRGVEAVAYAARAMAEVVPAAVWTRPFGPDAPVLEKRFEIRPRGIGLVICCASFPTWNAWPALFASLATGNPVIVKPHPGGVLPMAISVAICRDTLARSGFDPNLVTLAVDSAAEPVALRYVDHPAVQIVDFTGSPRFGQHLERTVTGKLLFTETAGVNSVVMHSTDDPDGMVRAVAFACAYFSAQMCTSPQVLFIPAEGVATPAGRIGYEALCASLVAEWNLIAGNPKQAAAVFGAVQSEASLALLDRVAAAAEAMGGRILRRHAPYAHPEFPDARTTSPLAIACDPGLQALYAEEHFAPVVFLVRSADADAALAEATHLARTRGAISAYLYATEPGFLERAFAAYAAAGTNVSANLTGRMPINFLAAYSDYHVTGLNPAGNACLTDAAFVAGRFRIVQRRWPRVA